MASSEQDHFNDVLAELKVAYIAQLGPYVLDMEQYISDFKSASVLEPEKVKSCYRLVHTLSGNSEVFGFAQIGQKAAIAKQDLMPLVKEPKGGHQVDKAQLVKKLEALMLVCQSAIENHGLDKEEV